MATPEKDPGFGAKRMSRSPAKRTQEEEEVSLWVQNVLRFSSQYNNSSWSANQIRGEPRVYPRYGDYHGSWAQQHTTGREWIEVEFAESLMITGIDIYETYHAGAVVKIAAKKLPLEEWRTIWQTNHAQVLDLSRIFSPPLNPPPFPTKFIRVEVDCSASQSWCELDAIKLKGKRPFKVSAPPMSELSEDLAMLVNNERFSDVKLWVDGQCFFGHRAILSARSSYFESMFCSGMRESTQADVKIPNVDADVFSAVLSFIYTNTVNCPPSLYVRLIQVADMFNLESLQRLCASSLVGQLTVANVIDVFKAVCSQAAPPEDIRKLCLDFIVSHFKDVTQTSSFVDLPQPLMLEIIQESAKQLSIH